MRSFRCAGKTAKMDRDTHIEPALMQIRTIMNFSSCYGRVSLGSTNEHQLPVTPHLPEDLNSSRSCLMLSSSRMLNTPPDVKADLQPNNNKEKPVGWPMDFPVSSKPLTQRDLLLESRPRRVLYTCPVPVTGSAMIER